MAANGPVIVAASDASYAPPDQAAFALSALHGVCFSEELPCALIEALVGLAANADAATAVVSLFRGPALTGTELQVFYFEPTSVAAAEHAQCVVRFLVSELPGADVEYSLGITIGSASGASAVDVYGFTATTFPGGVTTAANND